jgi:hypothetical protein
MAGRNSAIHAPYSVPFSLRVYLIPILFAYTRLRRSHDMDQRGRKP